MQTSSEQTGLTSRRKGQSVGKLGEIRLFPSILVAATLVAAMDLVLTPILGDLYHFGSITIVLVYDFSVVLITGLAGLLLAPRTGCPVWWRRDNRSSVSHQATYVTALLGLSVVILNTLNNVINIGQAEQLAPWMALLTPVTALAISLRAALNEEIIFRLFLFSLVAWIVWRFGNSQKASLVIGALVSALAFGLIHGLGFVPAFLVGLALIYIYHQRGLLSVMAVHFLADAIPFLLISVML